VRHENFSANRNDIWSGQKFSNVRDCEITKLMSSRNRFSLFCETLGRSLRIGSLIGLSIYAFATFFDVPWLIQHDQSYYHSDENRAIESMSHGELQREYERIVNEQILKQRQ
jgi:hypothetical protein